jgi:hypothetical protein
MQRCGKCTRGSRAAAANRRVGVSPYRRAGMQIGTTNGRECGSFNSRPFVSSRGYVEVLHVIGGSNNLRELPGPAVFISEFRFGYQSGFFIRSTAGGNSSGAKAMSRRLQCTPRLLNPRPNLSPFVLPLRTASG